MCFIENKSYFITADVELNIKIWDFYRNTMIYSTKIGHEKVSINQIAFKNSILAIACQKGDTVIFTYKDDELKFKINLFRNNAEINYICFNNNGKKLATASKDQKVK